MKPKPDNNREVTKLIGQFLDLYKLGKESWQQAGELLVRALELDENVFEKIIAQSDKLKIDHLITFERIGRKEIMPEMLIDESWGAKRVLELGYSYEKQKDLLERPIEVVIMADSGEIRTEHRRLNELTKSQAKLVLDYDGPRSKAQQADIVRQQAITREQPRYRTDETGIQFYASTRLTWADIEEILSKRPKPNALDIQGAIRRGQIGG